ncbi:MAG: hypothetical protein ACLFRX_01335 [Gemmatimonadota bacterium]
MTRIRDGRSPLALRRMDPPPVTALPVAVRTTIAPLAIVALLATVAPLPAQGGGATGDGVPQMFSVAAPCMACHNGLASPTGEDISFGTDWRPSMMANAARDPYWQAAVRRETMEHPGAAGAIQDECSKCHMPMAQFQVHATGQEFEAFGRLPWQTADGRLAALAADGVSCTMCHQIEAEGLGEEETFTGGFHVDTRTPLGERSVYGPYDVPQGSARAMLSSGLFQPTQSTHVQRAELCASCHTLYTHARNARGEVVGELPEQMPYLEWLNSDYPGQQDCQSCHMPAVRGETPISSTLPTPRPDVNRHVFRGGNFFMPRVFNAYRDELAVQALPAELELMAFRTREHLRNEAARVRVGEPSMGEDGLLEFDVEVRNLAGHKLPTAYPSRRAWLHVVVTDASGRALFESGALRPDGSIVGNDNDVSADRYERHHTVIREPDQVQVYEAIMVDGDGRVTTGLLKGVRFTKDNRVLPTGFDKAGADPDVAVNGEAVDDGDFAAGSDRVRFEVDAAGAARPLEVTVELWYQPIAFRWAHNLADFEALETDRFVRYYEALSDSTAMMLARASRAVD